MLSLVRALVQSLVGELRSHKPQDAAKKKKRNDIHMLMVPKLHPQFMPY